MAPAVEEPPPSADAGACPDDMVLVDGEYCTDVKHECVKEWYSDVNKKRVCEEFAPKSECVGQRVPKRFCIDKYSWPNVVGARPEVMNNFYQAQVKCAAIGKRLCTESEWTMACEGPEMYPFPYGYVRDTNKCNGDREWDHPDMVKVAKRDPAELARLWQGTPNGAQPECVSPYGVHDLPGNTDDVVQSETSGPGFRGKYDSVTTGGPWYKGVRNQCRPKIYTHNEGFYYYYLGFRCCAEPDGKETDPRGPKQIERGWDFERIERLARFTREEMREKLRLKAEGKCDCAEKDVLCKTMCGTLLGPDVKDVQLKPSATPTSGSSQPSAPTTPAR
jgi:sulfatase modifying factor 1